MNSIIEILYFEQDLFFEVCNIKRNVTIPHFLIIAVTNSLTL